MTTRARDERDMDDIVRSWLRDDDSPAMDRNRQIGRIMGRVDETKQRRRLWPLNPFGRRAMHSATDPDGQSSPISPTTGVVKALTPLRAMAAMVILALGGSLLLYVADALPVPMPAPGAATPAERLAALIERNKLAWEGERELLSETYAPDGVHTATFYDRTTTYVGAEEIVKVAWPGVQTIGPRIDIELTADEWRWADFVALGGGSVCLWHAVDGHIERHDCLVPEMSNEIRSPADVTEDPATLSAIADVRQRLGRAWSSTATMEDVEAAYAPDAVHRARYLDSTVTYDGREAILDVARGGDMVSEGAIVAFTAPEGELAWASVSDVGGWGVVCHFRAQDGLLFRHDCLMPFER